MNRLFPYLVITVICLTGCGGQNELSRENARFRLLPPSETGVDFVNALNPDDYWNIIDYLYYYNGAGVAVGDVDNDGLPDLFFTANEGPNKLYRNLGNLKFEDITRQAGILPGGWSTGTTMADVNGDGWLDIYVCQVGRYQGRKEKNQLFINNQDGTFTESGRQYGLDFSGLSTQSAFFDYDLDGDLDMYLLNHSVHSVNTYGPATIRNQNDDLAGDRLYRNDLDESGNFTDVTGPSGIYSSQIGYGLGLAIVDYNGDQWPDIYVSNDFHENDYLYENQGNGTFREVGEEKLGHTSRYSMGNEAGDINNDGNMDILTLDMLPGDPYVLRKSAAEDRIEVSEIKSRYGYGPQYVRNSLQVNTGSGSFSDVAPMAGIYATDWSWGGLMFDMENDGLQDIYITNGIVRRPNDLDYIQYLASASQKNKKLSDTEMTGNMPVLKISNTAFHNAGGLQFGDSTGVYGLETPSFSNGAVYSDLDRDGDLDLVVNNINDPAFVWENRGPSANYLVVELSDTSANRFGIGARIEVYTGGTGQTREIQPTRGFMSAVEPTVHFGLGEASGIDSILIQWPGHRLQKLTEVDVNQRLKIRPGNLVKQAASGKEEGRYFDDPDQTITWSHRENEYRDYKREPLIPYELSMEGPAVAVGDVDGDGLEDIYLGGAHAQPGVLFSQGADGFRKQEIAIFREDRMFEDVDAAFADVDQDGDLDLYVVSGGNQYPQGSDLLRDRLYINEGGTFSLDSRVVLPEGMNGSTVIFSDINGDSFPDAFVGVRSVPGVYGAFPNSYIWLNDGTGMLVRQEEWSVPGMISDAVWFDSDGDGDEDLCVVGDWMPVTIYQNEEGTLSMEGRVLEGTRGWWTSVAAGDLNNDGRTDLLAGNAGLNMILTTSADRPVELYLNDIDGNGQPDPILFYWKGGKNIPFATKDELDKQVPAFKKKYSSYEAYALDDNLRNVIEEMSPEGGTVRNADTFASLYLENSGDGRFHTYELPGIVQWSAVQDFFIGKKQANGTIPVILGGNSFAMNIGIGRLDAMPGTIVEFNGANRPVVAENFLDYGIQGNFRAVRGVKIGNRQHILLVRNNGNIELKKLENN